MDLSGNGCCHDIHAAWAGKNLTRRAFLSLSLACVTHQGLSLEGGGNTIEVTSAEGICHNHTGARGGDLKCMPPTTPDITVTSDMVQLLNFNIQL